MTSQAKAVLWIGLILIAANLGRQWKQIRNVIFTPGPASGTSSGSSISGTPLILAAHETPQKHKASTA